MDALSRLLMLNAPQGTIDKNCVLGSDWQLPHGAGELSVIRWHALTQGAAKLEMPTGEIFTLRPGNVVLLPQNSAHRLSHVDNESTCIVCGTLRLQHSARYFLTSLPETLFLASIKTGSKRKQCFLHQSKLEVNRNSVSSTVPIGMMPETLFLASRADSCSLVGLYFH